MYIAFASGRGVCDNLAGDTIQMRKTKKFLENNYDITIDLINNPNDLNVEYDILHLFNLPFSRGAFSYIYKAKNKDIKIATSTIFWDFSYSQGMKILNKLKIPLTIANPFNLKLLNWLYKKSFIKNKDFLNANIMKKCINKSDVLLPNSFLELKKLSNFVNLKYKELEKKSVIIPNAVDKTIFKKDNAAKKRFIEKYNIEDFVLQVGRITPSKNQISVVKALDNHPEIPIVFVGKGNGSYHSQLKKISKKRGNVYFFEEIQHKELNDFYNSARIHILPSFRDSPGLVSLEAALCGSEIIVSDNRFCPSKEYFGDFAYYCKPYSLRSIEENILLAYETTKNVKEFREIIRSDYCWEKTANLTFKAYNKII